MYLEEMGKNGTSARQVPMAHRRIGRVTRSAGRPARAEPTLYAAHSRTIAKLSSSIPGRATTGERT